MKSIADVKADAMSVELFAEIMGISPNSAYKAVHSGDVPVIRIGKLMRIPTSWVREQLLVKQQDAA